MHKEISSFQNPTIKRLIQHQEKSRERRKSGLFIIEGYREITLAAESGYLITELFLCREILDSRDEKALLALLPEETTITTLTSEVYNRIAYRSSTEGAIAFAKAKQHQLNDLHLPENPLILIAEAPEKPGNIGALLRTADAAGVDAFILANPKTDLYNPNIIRSSVGALFTQQIATSESRNILTYLSGKKIAIFSAILQDAKPYQEQDYTTASAIVVGTEADGLTDIWRENSTQNIIIPMQGKLDSMNVSVAAGILIFEARRQRGFR